MHHLVLLRAQAQGDVLVRNPGQQVVRQMRRVVDQETGKRGHRTGQRLLLPAIGLVAPVEQAVEQLGVFTEHVLVETGRYFLDMLAHHGKGGPDDGIRGL